jgi:hypothetical protein
MKKMLILLFVILQTNVIIANRKTFSKHPTLPIGAPAPDFKLPDTASKW